MPTNKAFLKKLGSDLKRAQMTRLNVKDYGNDPLYVMGCALTELMDDFENYDGVFQTDEDGEFGPTTAAGMGEAALKRFGPLVSECGYTMMKATLTEIAGDKYLNGAVKGQPTGAAIVARETLEKIEKV